MENSLVIKVLSKSSAIIEVRLYGLNGTNEYWLCCGFPKQNKKSNILNNFLVVFCPFAKNSAYFYVIHVFHGRCISNQELQIFH